MSPVFIVIIITLLSKVNLGLGVDMKFICLIDSSLLLLYLHEYYLAARWKEKEKLEYTRFLSETVLRIL